MKDFLGPKSQMTPALLGGTTLLITNTMCSQFEVLSQSPPFVGLAISFLFSIAVIYQNVIKLTHIEKYLYGVINAFVIFTFAFGVNNTIDSKITPRKYPKGAYSEKTTGSDNSTPVGKSKPQVKFQLITSAYAQTVNVNLVKGSGPEVFILHTDTRHWIPNPETFKAFGFSWNAIKTISDAELNKIPRGENYPELHNSVIKGSGPEVYSIQGGKRRWIPNPETFEAMGFDWNTIQIIPDQKLQLIPEGEKLPYKRRFFSRW